MKIVSITPIHVTAAELERRQQRYNRIAPSGVTVELRNLTQGSPTALDTPTDVRASDASLLTELSSASEAGAGYLAGNGLLAAVGFAYLAAKAIAKAS